MRIDDIKAHVRRQPFQPVRIHVSDQAVYEIRHPELILIGRTEIVIGLPGADSDVFERLVYVDPVRVTRIERIRVRRRPRASPRKRLK